MTPQLTIDGRIATLRLDAPERRNAIGPDDVRELLRAFAAVEREPEVRVLVLEATGTTFCAGYDLRALEKEIGGVGSSAAQREFPEAVDRLERLRMPTICAMRGAAYGGGVDLALACDFRIGTDRVSIEIPAVRIGLSFYHGGLRRAVERLGIETAKRLFLLAEKIDAHELHRLGFLLGVVADADLATHVSALIGLLTTNDAEAIAEIKNSLAAVARGDADGKAIDEGFAARFRAPSTALRLGIVPERLDAR